ncbi:hypothetical protein GCM10010218_45180 [Streptomyces mashuensis]|uniref:Uncharacterized protein n=1 Tax=Streptomyces mashuensis TaxID=33904 RepID=A0A919B6X1_9ACTN|nr:hypothetical protein GCM10010218_45180 [Streptomyces mashuensis]
MALVPVVMFRAQPGSRGGSVGRTDARAGAGNPPGGVRGTGTPAARPSGSGDAVDQVGGVLRPVVGVLGQQVEDQAGEARGQFGPDLAERPRRRVAVAHEHRPGVVHVEGRRAGGDLVEHAAQGVQVAAVVDAAAADLLGRHVVRGAHGDAGAGEPRGEADVVAEAGDAEVADLHRAVGDAHDVGGLEVAVHHALPVRVRERGPDLRGDVDDLGHGQRVLVAVLQQLAEVAAVEQLHHQVQDAVVLAEVVHDGDAPVLEGRRHPGLAPEPLPQHPQVGRVVLTSHRLEALHGDVAAQRFVARPPHLSHAAPADQVEQLVPALDQPGVRHPAPPPPSFRRALPRFPKYGGRSGRLVGRRAGRPARRRARRPAGGPGARPCLRSAMA